MKYLKNNPLKRWSYTLDRMLDNNISYYGKIVTGKLVYRTAAWRQIEELFLVAEQVLDEDE